MVSVCTITPTGDHKLHRQVDLVLVMQARNSHGVVQALRVVIEAATFFQGEGAAVWAVSKEAWLADGACDFYLQAGCPGEGVLGRDCVKAGRAEAVQGLQGSMAQAHKTAGFEQCP